KVLFSLSSGFSAEISVFVKTGDSVQLDIQTQDLPEFYLLSWRNAKSEIIVRYTTDSKKVLHSSYKDRVDFNDETFSLTLKNMQKTDTGLYTARTIGESENNIAIYRVSVIDEVETPVLTVNSNWSSPDSCSFTCKSSSCSPEEETSSDNYTLNLNCSDDYIMCNYSNPVSWKTARKKVNELCTVDQGTYLYCIHTLTYVTLDHKTSHKSHRYICGNSQQYIIWVKIIDFFFMPKIIRILSKDHDP
ncbi:hypothetical protein PO909_031478, partial [Leuciscus waleckii]